MKNILLVVLIAVMGGFVACSRSNEKRYDLKGKVVSVEPEKRRVTISHENINSPKVFHPTDIVQVQRATICPRAAPDIARNIFQPTTRGD